ncbi:hypothetical protein QQM39_08900 [Streptomyces sp. DT2A-34]|uniref:hypothetical protein n=1 Tax=Streptomyces sp. DT2A-34 TaxID=3051182 RepID=UPI00265BDE16|nr:hypothetical protein [Streptomyces sp. DT2A-34]MDO0910968.1 hypothetical protein [Streptomyces sp. DT2A-34]
MLLIASLGWLGFLVPTSPWWITEVFRPVDDLGSFLGALFAAVLWLGLPGMVAVLAGIRPGNAALRRRVLAMDGEGVWIYESAKWWSAPRLVPWRDANPVRVYTLDHTDIDPADTGPGPTLVPWDFLQFGDPPQATIHLLWLTATAEVIVAQARRRRPDLTVLDQRTPPGIGSWRLGTTSASPAPLPDDHAPASAEQIAGAAHGVEPGWWAEFAALPSRSSLRQCRSFCRCDPHADRVG